MLVPYQSDKSPKNIPNKYPYVNTMGQIWSGTNFMQGYTPGLSIC